MPNYEKVPAELEGPIVSIHSGAMAKDEQLLSQRRAGLYQQVEEVGGHPVMTRGDTLDEETGEFKNYYTFESDTHTSFLVKHDERTSAHSARDFSWKLETDRFPFLNHPAIRELCIDKPTLYGLLPHLMPESRTVDLSDLSNESDSDIDTRFVDAIESLGANDVVVKPARGSMGRYVSAGDINSILNAVKTQRSGKKPENRWIVQQKINNTGLPEDIKAAGDMQRDKLQDLKQESVAKEVRLVMVDEDLALGVVRSAHPDNKTGFMGKHDHWVFIDQDSIPPSMLEQAKQTVATIRKQANVYDSLITVDQIYDQGNSWVVDVNHESLIQVHQDESWYPYSRDQERADKEYWFKYRNRSIARKLIRMGEHSQC